MKSYESFFPFVGFYPLCVYPNSMFYWATGKSDLERKTDFRNVIRHSMIQLVAETEIPLNWVAAVRVAKSSEMVAMIVVSKKIFDMEMGEFILLKECFPFVFYDRAKSIYDGLNHIEFTIAKSFFECAAQSENFESRVDDLIKISRKYKFELPLSYYAFRYLDAEGNLMTAHEKMMPESKAKFIKYERVRLGEQKKAGEILNFNIADERKIINLCAIKKIL